VGDHPPDPAPGNCPLFQVRQIDDRNSSPFDGVLSSAGRQADPLPRLAYVPTAPPHTGTTARRCRRTVGFFVSALLRIQPIRQSLRSKVSSCERGQQLLARCYGLSGDQRTKIAALFRNR